MSHIFNRKTPAALPPHQMLSFTSLRLPDVFDGRRDCGLVKDQKTEGSCTGNTGASAGEWIYRAYLHKSPTFSPQYTYAKELLSQNSFPQDVGSDGVTLCNTLIADGLCEESLYPYIPGQILIPNNEQNANAAQHRMGAYHGLIGSAVALSVLGNPVPWPVEIGFRVYQSFENSNLSATGVMPVPRYDEPVLGGHEVLMVGYDVGDKPTLRPAGCPKAALIQNSWSTSWGLSGFFWMPLTVLDAPDTDLKIVHSGRAWK